MKKNAPLFPVAPAAPDALPPGVAGALAGALAATELLVALFDAQDRLCWCNAPYARCFLDGAPRPTGPLPFAEVLRHGFRHGLGVRIDCGDVEAFLRDILPRRRAVPFRAIEVDTVDGRWLHMAETLLPEGWLLCVGSDITRLKDGERSLRRARAVAESEARTDVLTGAPNRRHLFEFGKAALARCAAARQPCSAALIDLDHFKHVNDGYGHDVGDAVLRAFAAQARRGLREGDLFGRLGGEEFLLLIAGRSEVALEVTNRLRRRLEPLALDGGLVHYGFSAGVAQAHPGDGMDRLITRADRALYRAKVSGRGRTELASEDDGSGLNTAASS